MLKEDGYYNGNFSDFTSNIDKENGRRELFSMLKEDGYYNGDWETFNRNLTGDKKRYSVRTDKGTKYFDTKEEAQGYSRGYNECAEGERQTGVYMRYTDMVGAVIVAILLTCAYRLMRWRVHPVVSRIGASVSRCVSAARVSITSVRRDIAANKLRYSLYAAVMCAAAILMHGWIGDKRLMRRDSMTYIEEINSVSYIIHSNVGCSKAKSISGKWRKFEDVNCNERICTHCFWQWDIEEIANR